jgi:predicted lipid-binding transport protein (Tim44 family)
LAAVGLLLGSRWIGPLVGIGMTIIPGVALLALLINNLVIGLLRLLMVVGLPFFLAYRGIRRVAPHKAATNPDRHGSKEG